MNKKTIVFTLAVLIFSAASSTARNKLEIEGRIECPQKTFAQDTGSPCLHIKAFEQYVKGAIAKHKDKINYDQIEKLKEKSSFKYPPMWWDNYAMFKYLAKYPTPDNFAFDSPYEQLGYNWEKLDNSPSKRLVIHYGYEYIDIHLRIIAHPVVLVTHRVSKDEIKYGFFKYCEPYTDDSEYVYRFLRSNYFNKPPAVKIEKQMYINDLGTIKVLGKYIVAKGYSDKGEIIFFYRHKEVRP